MCRSRRRAVLLASYLIGLGVAALSLKLAISVGVVMSMLWLFNHDEVSYQKNYEKRKLR